MRDLGRGEVSAHDGEQSPRGLTRAPGLEHEPARISDRLGVETVGNARRLHATALRRRGFWRGTRFRSGGTMTMAAMARATGTSAWRFRGSVPGGFCFASLLIVAAA